MKHINYITILLFCLMVLSSCSDENESAILMGNAAVFTSLISGLEPTAKSRASGADWLVNDRVGVFMLASGDDTFPALADNCEYFATASGKNTALLPASSGQTIYYPMDDSGVTFMAYYPYTSSLGDDDANPVYAVDLTDQSSLEDLDLLYHKGTTVYSNTLPNATLNFEHQLVKMEINISRGVGIEIPLTDMVIKFKGMPATADFDLATGKLTNEGSAVDIVPGTLSVTADEAHYSAIVMPQDAIKGRAIAFSLGSLDYSYEIPDDLDLEAGKVYTLNFSFGEAEATFMGVTIRDWATDTPIDGYTVSLFNKEYFFSKEAYQRNSLIIKTDYPDLPLIRFSSSDADPGSGVTGDWLYQSVAASPDEDTYYKVGSENGIHTYELLFDVAVNGGDERIAYIHITIGSRSLAVPVKQSNKDIMSYVYKQPESNCYIVHPDGVGIAIPVSRANTFAVSAEGQSDGATVISGDFTTELLWSDVAGTNNTGLATDAAVRYVGTYGTGGTGYVIVQPGTQEGNAVVTVKVNDVIKWSWHIWVTAYNPYINDNPRNEDVTFMDRNLGATMAPGYTDVDKENSRTYGLYYQWGRKDPFPGKADETSYYGPRKDLYSATTDLITPDIRMEMTTILGSVKGPDVFYYYSVGSINDVPFNYQWHDPGADGSGLNNYLWNEKTTGGKTIYDPCPVGWRVPTTNCWTNYLTQSFYDVAGATSNSGDWYPSAGMVNGNSGNMHMVGRSGYYWTTMTQYGVSNNLIFDGSNLMIRTQSRSSALSIRCVKVE